MGHRSSNFYPLTHTNIYSFRSTFSQNMLLNECLNGEKYKLQGQQIQYCLLGDGVHLEDHILFPSNLLW